MAFLTKAELATGIYEYQLDQITENDDAKVLTGIETAIEEVKSYLTPNNQKQWKDGRLLYDVEAIFSATGTSRNALILEHTKTFAEWHIIKICNADLIYEHVKERYDRATNWLTMLQEGKVSINSLPTLDPEGENVTNTEPFSFGSRKKFNHE